MNNEINRRLLLFTGLLSIIAIPTTGIAFAAEAAYISGQTSQGELSKVEGNVNVYGYLLSNSAQMVSLIYATDASGTSDYTVGVGYLASDYSPMDILYELSYEDHGSTYNNKHYLGSSLTEHTMSVKLLRSGNAWVTYHDGGAHKTMNCPGATPTCPTNFRIMGAATNASGSTSDMVFLGSFSNLKAKAGTTDASWSTHFTGYTKCNASSDVYASQTGWNTASFYEGTTGENCPESATWVWLYNNDIGSFGVT